MAQATTAFRQGTYRLLPQMRNNWRWLERALEARRVLYNAALQEHIDCYAQHHHLPVQGSDRVPEGVPDMAACPVAVQHGTLRRLDEAYSAFFRRGGFPRFKRRRH